MSSVISFINNNIYSISIFIMIATNILNAITTHWSENTGLKKWILFIIDILSVVKSKNSDGITIKAPLVTKSIKKKDTEQASCDTNCLKFIVPLTITLSMLGASCSTTQSNIKLGAIGIHESVKGLSVAIEESFRVKCSAIATKCKEEKDVVCKDLTECQNSRSMFNKAVIAIHSGVYAVLGLLATDSVDKAMRELASLKKMTNDFLNELKKGGVL